jgi:hypothetical protein
MQKINKLSKIDRVQFFHQVLGGGEGKFREAEELGRGGPLMKA